MGMYYIVHIPSGELIHRVSTYDDGEVRTKFTIGPTKHYMNRLASFLLHPNCTPLIYVISNDTKEPIEHFEVIEK